MIIYHHNPVKRLQHLPSPPSHTHKHALNNCPTGVMVLGGSCPGGNCPRGSYPMGVMVLWGSCPRDRSPQGSFPRGSCPRGSCPRGSCPRGSCPVTILTKCITALYTYHTFIILLGRIQEFTKGGGACCSQIFAGADYIQE